jgi:hypothetical protein
MAFHGPRPTGHALGDTRPAKRLDRQTLAMDHVVEIVGIPIPVEQVIPRYQPRHPDHPVQRTQQRDRQAVAIGQGAN